MLDSAAARKRWRLLIYTVPSEPSRKRAFIWRELKKAGAIYLRDGVCALPDRPDTASAIERIAATIEEFEGEPTVIGGVELENRRAQAIVDAADTERKREYVELLHETANLLSHVEREAQHREFTVRENQELQADLHKLRVWFAQIQSRDYFGCENAGEAGGLLKRCEHALSGLGASSTDRATP